MHHEKKPKPISSRKIRRATVIVGGFTVLILSFSGGSTDRARVDGATGTSRPATSAARASEPGDLVRIEEFLNVLSDPGEWSGKAALGPRIKALISLYDVETILDKQEANSGPVVRVEYGVEEGRVHHVSFIVLNPRKTGSGQVAQSKEAMSAYIRALEGLGKMAYQKYLDPIEPNSGPIHEIIRPRGDLPPFSIWGKIRALEGSITVRFPPERSPFGVIPEDLLRAPTAPRSTRPASKPAAHPELGGLPIPLGADNSDLFDLLRLKKFSEMSVTRFDETQILLPSGHKIALSWADFVVRKNALQTIELVFSGSGRDEVAALRRFLGGDQGESQSGDRKIKRDGTVILVRWGPSSNFGKFTEGITVVLGRAPESSHP